MVSRATTYLLVFTKFGINRYRQLIVVNLVGIQQLFKKMRFFLLQLHQWFAKHSVWCTRFILFLSNAHHNTLTPLLIYTFRAPTLLSGQQKGQQACQTSTAPIQIEASPLEAFGGPGLTCINLWKKWPLKQKQKLLSVRHISDTRHNATAKWQNATNVIYY